MAANLVSLERVSKRHAEKQVLDEVTLGIDDGDRVGVIGVNGSGKSTLLQIIARAVQPDAGRVVHGRHVRIHHSPQEPLLDGDLTVLQAALKGAGAAQGLELPGEEGQREATARGMLAHLGLRDLDRRVGELSGGQRKRIAMARALLEDVELLILDEPTNHLDVDVVDWLEGQLVARSGALLLVTHDRYLLDRVANRIVEVERGQLHTSHGSYADYLEARALREEQAAATERRRQNRLRTELAWLRRGARARTSKAKYRVDRAQELVAADPEAAAAELTIDLPARRLGGKVVNLHHAGKSYGDHPVLRDVDAKLAPGSRIGVVGPNGAGKSTLLGLIAGRIAPDRGSISVGETVHIGWYGQDPQPLPPDQRVLDAVKEVVLETNTIEGLRVSAAELLERFQFDADAQKAVVGELSGGERRRLELLRVLADAPNLLLLDEPTNDLDLDTLAVLEEYLDRWPGALVVASHDRYFLDRVCDDLFSIQPDGRVRHHPGGWSQYRAQVAWERAQERERERAADRARGADDGRGAQRATADRGRQKLSYNERRELGRLESRLPQLEARRTALEADLVARSADHAAAAELGRDLAVVMAEIDAAELRWLELSEVES